MPKEINAGDGDASEPLLRRGVWRPDEAQAPDKCIERSDGHGKSASDDNGDDDYAQEHCTSKECH